MSFVSAMELAMLLLVLLLRPLPVLILLSARSTTPSKPLKKPSLPLVPELVDNTLTLCPFVYKLTHGYNFLDVVNVVNAIP